MPWTLACRHKGLVPEAVDDSGREGRYDGFNRRMMSRPITFRAGSVYAAAVRTPPALEPQRSINGVKIAKHEPVAPDTKTAASCYKTLLRPGKGILLSKPENLIDTD
ncbi:MAG: hypothetical protein AABY09_00520 [Nanoarchaeota archaeon]